jgi:DNA-binding GntR family transcriptional regulator
MARTTSDGTPAVPGPLADPAALRIDRSSTAERVADVLRELIVRGDLPAGTALREQQLVGSLDVSRNTLREAFRLLGRERLVSYHLHRGVTVREVDEHDVEDLYRTRAPLELTAVEYSATASRAQLEELLGLVEQAERAAAEKDWKQVATLNVEFHERLVDLIGSERISAFFHVVSAELRLAFAAVEPAPDFFRPFIPRNRTVAELLLAGDRDAAAEELKTYLREAEGIVRSAVRAASAAEPRPGERPEAAPETTNRRVRPR